MKKILGILVVMLVMMSGMAQELTYESLQTMTDLKMLSYKDFTQYTASDGTVIKIGDMVEFGESSGDTRYKHIMTYVPLATPTNISSGFEGRKYEVIRITANGKNGNNYVGIWTKTAVGGAKYVIDCEPALKSGELVGNGLTSDKALNELEKMKKKLDLGIITQEEYDAAKTELIKYIK